MSITTARLRFQGAPISLLFGLALLSFHPSPGLAQITLEPIPDLVVHPEADTAVVGDFDQDTHLDLFLGNDREYVVLLAFGDGTGALPRRFTDMTTFDMLHVTVLRNHTLLAPSL